MHLCSDFTVLRLCVSKNWLIESVETACGDRQRDSGMKKPSNDQTVQVKHVVFLSTSLQVQTNRQRIS